MEIKKHTPVSTLESHLGYWFRLVSNHVSHQFRDTLLIQGFSVSEWVILCELYDFMEASPSKLTERIGMTKGAISKILVKLEQKGLIERRVDQTDRRNQMIVINQEGQDAVVYLASLADENDAQFFAHLSVDEHAELMQIMKQIVRHHGWRDIPTE